MEVGTSQGNARDAGSLAQEGARLAQSDSARKDQRRAYDTERVANETSAALDALKRNSWLNFAARIGLYVAAIASLAAAVIYTTGRGDSMVGVLLDRSADGLATDDLLTLALPDLILLTLAAACLGSALAIQSRGMNDFELGLDAIGRLRREADVGVSRSRAASHVQEETLANAKRAFGLMLWLSRTLFIVCLILFTAAIVNALASGIDLLTASLGAVSVLGLIFAVAKDTPQNVGTHLANVSQVQTIVTGTIRQVNVIEEYLYQVLEERGGDPEAAQLMVAGATEMSNVVANGVELTQKFAEPAIAQPENKD